jgi:hypothetical protein
LRPAPELTRVPATVATVAEYQCDDFCRAVHVLAPPIRANASSEARRVPKTSNS